MALNVGNCMIILKSTLLFIVYEELGENPEEVNIIVILNTYGCSRGGSSSNK